MTAAGPSAATAPARAVLCVRRGALGDTLLTIPVLRWMRRRWPQTELHFAGAGDHAQLLAAYGVVDRALSSEDLELWAAELDGAAGERCRARLERYLAVVHADALPDPRQPVPAALQILRAVSGEAFASCDAVGPSGLVTASTGRAVPPAQPPFVVLHPGSGSPRKCWPFESFVALAAALARDGRGVVVTAGEIEGDAAPAWRVAFASASADVVVARSSVALAAAIAGATAYAGNDSGATHLAAALGVPTVAVFGPTEPRIWAPAFSHVHVVDAQSAFPARRAAPPDAPVAVVHEAVRRCLGAEPVREN